VSDYTSRPVIRPSDGHPETFFLLSAEDIGPIVITVSYRAGSIYRNIADIDIICIVIGILDVVF